MRKLYVTIKVGVVHGIYDFVSNKVALCNMLAACNVFPAKL